MNLRKGIDGVSPFLAWGDFHARSRFARSAIHEEKWGTTRSLATGRQKGEDGKTLVRDKRDRAIIARFDANFN